MVPGVSPISFQAHVPSRLKNKLFMNAYSMDKKVCDEYFKQMKNIESWGLDSSTITEIKPDGTKSKLLSLVNPYLAPFRSVVLPQKENLFETFLALTKRDIQDAENALKL